MPSLLWGGLVSAPLGAVSPPCPVCPMALAAPALHPWSLLLNTACPDPRDWVVGEILAKILLMAHIHHPSWRTTGMDSNCCSFSSESHFSRWMEKCTQTSSRLFFFYPLPTCSSSFWLFSAVAKSNIPKIQDGCIQQRHIQQLLKGATSLLSSACYVVMLEAPHVFWNISSVHIWSWAIPYGKGIGLQEV